MQLSNYIDLIISGAVSLGTALIGFIVGKKRSDREIEQLSLANVEQALGIYKDMLDDMKKRYDAEIESLKSKLKEYQEHIVSLESKIKTLTTKPKTPRKQSK
jgi:peptidoglycan hydrolase CwlO-like protein